MAAATVASAPAPAQIEVHPSFNSDVVEDEIALVDSKITVREAIQLPYESKDFSDKVFTSEELSPLIESWNVRDWLQVIAILEKLEENSKSLRPFLRHLHGIAHSLMGEWAEARTFFVENLNDRIFQETTGTLDKFVIATANWLASTSYILRKFEDAALAWAIAASSAISNPGDADEEKQAFTALSMLQNGEYTGIEGHVTYLIGALQSSEKKLYILPEVNGTKKAAYLTECLPLLSSSPSASAATDGSLGIGLSHTDFSDPLSALGSTPVLHRDNQLVLEARAHAHTESWGQPMAEYYLLSRFMNKVHFPMLNLTALYTTSNGIEWLVSTVRAGLQARGFITRCCWDRMRCSRIRSFPSSLSTADEVAAQSSGSEAAAAAAASEHMSYVTTFTIVFHRWPLGVNKQGFQIPMHLIHDSWNPNNPLPAATVYRRLCADVKALLPPENTPVVYQPPVVAHSPKALRLGWAGTTADSARLGLGSNRHSELCKPAKQQQQQELDRRSEVDDSEVSSIAKAGGAYYNVERRGPGSPLEVDESGGVGGSSSSLSKKGGGRVSPRGGLERTSSAAAASTSETWSTAGADEVSVASSKKPLLGSLNRLWKSKRRGGVELPQR